MGDPKKLKKKYKTPNHPWSGAAIAENKALREEYGLSIRKEILIAYSFLKKYKDIAKKLIAAHTEQSEKEKTLMMNKLQRLGLLQASAEIDHVLSLELKDVLERRLQSLVFRKGLARSMKQARQFITHRHIIIGSKEITSPGYIVSMEEEGKLQFKEKSSLADENHPERLLAVKETLAVKEVKEEAEKIKDGAKQEKKKKVKAAKPAGGEEVELLVDEGEE